MAKFKALSRGTQLVLVAGPLLFISLFFTWQNKPVNYGRAGIATMPLDGWDAWGLLLALIAILTVTLVALQRLTDVEMSPDVPWTTVAFGLGVSGLAVAILKSLLDDGSTWESYAFLALAGLVALGAYLDWASERKGEPAVLARKRRGISSAA